MGSGVFPLAYGDFHGTRTQPSLASISKRSLDSALGAAARSRAATTPVVTPALHHLLDTLETAVIEDHQEQVAALSDQLWPQRRHLPAVLSERLRTGRTHLPGLTLDLLIGYAGTRASALLKRVEVPGS